jgi:hypothetical protein
MKALMRTPMSTVADVSEDSFVKACVSFQHAKTFLASYLNGADVTSIDAVSSAVYNLTNKAVTRHKKSANLRAVKSGARRPLHALIAQTMRGRKQFSSQDVMDALKRRNMLPRVEDARGTISNALGMHKKVFQRVKLGVYKLKPAAGKLVYVVKKTPKELPAATA